MLRKINLADQKLEARSQPIDDLLRRPIEKLRLNLAATENYLLAPSSNRSHKLPPLLNHDQQAYTTP